LFVFGALGVGVLITLHMSMNATVGSLTGNPRMANIIFWAAGFVSSVAVGFLRMDPGFWKRAMAVPSWLFLAGAVGSGIALFTNLAIPRIGATNLTMILIASQLGAAAALSHWGLLGSPRDTFAWWKLVGIALTLVGTAIVLYGGRIFTKI
jgi:bacterial/archaeal transporter family-2 protein